MKKIGIIFLGLILSFSAFAQDDTKEEVKDGWTKGGTFSVLFSQSNFSNWTAGGVNNISGNIGLNYDFNYKKGDFTWDNKIIASYGIVKNEGDQQRKTDDRLEFNSLAGKKAGGNWYYSFFFNFKTQMDVGYDPDTNTFEISHFFSPAYFQTGPGMLWKKSDNLKVNIAPATARLIIVHDHFTVLGESFGVKQGETSRFELGAALGAYYKVDLMKNVTMENILNLYSNYLEDPQNVDIDYTMNLVMKVNKFLSANFTVQAIYDDNAFKGLQTRQVFGAGLTVGL